MFLAVRFDQLKVTEWEVIYVFWDMSRANVSYLAPMATILTESCLDTKSTQFTRANKDSVRSLANCASGCAADTTFTARHLVRITYAGMLTSTFPLPCHLPGRPVKNTCVAPYVLTEYAKLIQLRSLSNSLEGTRRFSISR